MMKMKALESVYNGNVSARFSGPLSSFDSLAQGRHYVS